MTPYYCNNLYVAGEAQSQGTKIILKWVKAVQGEAKYLQCLSLLLPLPPGRRLGYSANRGKLLIPIRYFPFLIGVDKINRNTLNPIGWELVAKGQSPFDSIASQHRAKTETVHAVPQNRAYASAEVIKMIKHRCVHSAHTAHCEKPHSRAPTKPWRFSIIAR